MNIDTAQFTALIFDLDGTLIDSMPLHNEAWIKTLQSFGHDLDEKVLYELAGIPTFDTVKILNQRYAWSLDPATITHQKESYYLSHLDMVNANDEILQIAKDHFQTKPMAIVTGGQSRNVKKVLEALKINYLFDAVICAEDTQNPKPSPEPFLLAARRLIKNPCDCLVFEDGESGILGAKAAGMAVIQVVPSFARSENKS